MKVDGSLGSLIQGVSQQPARTRLPGQCSLQENFSSNPVDGLTRRPPLDWIDDLFSTDDPVQFYNLRQGADNYVVCASIGNLRVFDMEGTEKTVVEEDDAFDYLDGQPLAITTLENRTFISNTEVTCLMETELPNFIDYNSILHVRGGNFECSYITTVTWKDAGPGGTEYSVRVAYTTPSTGTGNLRTTSIAGQILSLLQAETANSFNTVFTIERQEDTLYIKWADPLRKDTFSVVATESSANNANYIAVNNDVRMVSHLPRFAPHGYFVRVSGDGSQSQDDYYLEFSVNPDDQGVQPALGAGFGKAGIWIETVKAKIPYLINWSTMPHVLTYNEDDDEFVFAQGEYGDRTTGDLDSNPDPSFIGRKITELSYFQGRLVALAGPAVIMSRTNKPLDFFYESAVRTTDADPIDVQSTAAGVTTMLRAIPTNRDLVVFADGGAQFIILGRNTLTSENCSLVLTTSFEADLTARPVPAGRNVFFAIKYGAYTGIREFFTAGEVDINDSRPVTQHVLKYIDGHAQHLASSSNFDMLLVKSGSANEVYVYEYIWQDSAKVQSSWSTWILPDEVKFFFFVESIIYFVTKVGDDYALQKMDLNTQFDDDVGYQVKLDRKVTVDSVDTVFTNPVPYEDDPDKLVFIQGAGCPHPGMRATIASYDPDTRQVTLHEDMEDGTVIGGVRYVSRYRPTMPMVKDQDKVKIGTGTLTVAKFLVNCRESGSMLAKLISKYREVREVYFSGRAASNPNTVVGEEAITDSTYLVPCRDNADYVELELYTDSHTPLTVMDIDWIGQYNKRGKRISQGIGG